MAAACHANPVAAFQRLGDLYSAQSYPHRPTARFVSRGKLPDRKDFHYYGANNAFRTLNWKLAISEGARLRDALANFIEKSDPRLVQPI
jgi:hypothetical protein